MQMLYLASGYHLISLQPPSQDTGIYIMLVIARPGHIAIEVRVAVPAEMPAGIILPDIHALHAAADLTLRWILADIHCPAKHCLNPGLIDAGTMLDTISIQIQLLRTGLYRDP